MDEQTTGEVRVHDDLEPEEDSLPEAELGDAGKEKGEGFVGQGIDI